MRTNEDRNWELIESMLAAESSGKSPRLFSSRRTLFGIPSALDEEMAKLDAQAAKEAKEASEKAAKSAKAKAKTTPASSSAKAKAQRESAGTPSVEPPRTATAALQAAKPAHASATMPATRNESAAQRVVHPLAPVFDEHSRVLILGTMPSPKSRATGFYYNHPQNRFWKVLAALFDDPMPTANEEKEALARDHGIALWDVLAECSIEGAADGTIAECVPNDIAWLLGQTSVEAVFCTGAKATELYRKYCEPATGKSCTRLPSTSPANAAVSLEQLIKAYQQILPYCR